MSVKSCATVVELNEATLKYPVGWVEGGVMIDLKVKLKVYLIRSLLVKEFTLIYGELDDGKYWH